MFKKLIIDENFVLFFKVESQKKNVQYLHKYVPMIEFQYFESNFILKKTCLSNIESKRIVKIG